MEECGLRRPQRSPSQARNDHYGQEQDYTDLRPSTSTTAQTISLLHRVGKIFGTTFVPGVLTTRIIRSYRRPHSSNDLSSPRTADRTRRYFYDVET